MKRLASPEMGRVQSPAEQEGKRALHRYVREFHGRQAQLSRATGLHTVVLSKMANQPEYIITLDAAMMMEVATEGELRADVLCPSRAELMEQFVALRSRELAEA